MIQRGNEFQQGKQNHNHPPAAVATTAARVIASVKERDVEDQFKQHLYRLLICSAGKQSCKTCIGYLFIYLLVCVDESTLLV